MKRIRLSCLTLAAAAVCLTGCSSSSNPSSVNYSAIRNNLTP